MREIYIKENESGQRFDKFLKKYLSEAPGSFLYKMLRKKNIVLNGRKATGSEKLKKGDQVKLFLADETLEKFTGKQETAHSKKKLPKIQMPVVYEDEDVVFYNKPAGVLSQKAKPSDVSVVEYLMEHLLETKALRQDDLRHSDHPSATGWTGIRAALLLPEKVWRDYRSFQNFSKTGH